MKETGSCIVSWDFANKHSGVLIVGQQFPKKGVQIVNAFQDEEAYELFKKLTVKKEKEN